MTPYEKAKEDAKAEEKELRAIKEKREADGILHIMNSVDGRNFMFDSLAACGIWKSTFNKDVMQMSFNEGKRAHGLNTMARLEKHAPKKVALMVKENDPFKVKGSK